jgi:hypothetical protein
VRAFELWGVFAKGAISSGGLSEITPRVCPMLTPYYFKFDFKVYDTTKKRAKNER